MRQSIWMKLVGARGCLLFRAKVLTPLLLIGVLGLSPLGSAELERLDENMAWYKNTPASGAVARLEEKMAKGDVQLQFDASFGYLPSLLHLLDISPSSQLLVASKTSPNRALISPTNPRALYFNAQVNVAYVPHADFLEVAAVDPALGVVFYTLEQKKSDRPQLHRDDRCLECHASSKTLNVPGLLVRSFQTTDEGDVDILSGIMVNHRTPFVERWGGYYVTGTYGKKLIHRGNVFGAEELARHEADPSYHSNIQDLSAFLNPSKYPSPGSDIEALLVMDHQVHMLNLLTRLKRDAVRLLDNHETLENASPTFEAALQYMLCVEEAPLPSAVRGTSHYADWFASQGPVDPKGRSLHQLDLAKRLFKYRCSPMIYSTAFEALPRRAKLHFYHRLWEILSAEGQSPAFALLSKTDRHAIREILAATVSDIPVYWKL